MSKKPKIHPYYTQEEFRNLPYSKKKQAFVVWLMRQGVKRCEAVEICGKKFWGGRDPFPPVEDGPPYIYDGD